jgi:hypothetical protein
MSRPRRFLHENSLSIAFGILFLCALGGQAVAGWHAFNAEQTAHHNPAISLATYVKSASFAGAVMENWQSEYLQFTLFILLTVWLVQKGSPESKTLDKQGRESDEDQKLREHADSGSPRWARVGGVRTFVFSNSLLLLMTSIWIASWAAQSVTGVVAYNADRLDHHREGVSWVQYLGSSDFWERTLENWQSEFLAVGSMAVFAIYLRQRGSPESKPVGAPHDATGIEG